jgi:hypothetical protein
MNNAEKSLGLSSTVITGNILMILLRRYGKMILCLGNKGQGGASQGVLIEVVRYRKDFSDDTLRDVLHRYAPERLKQNLLAAFINGILLYGEKPSTSGRLES